MDRLVDGAPRCGLAVHRQQQPFSDLALGVGAPFGQPYSGANCPAHRGRLAKALPPRPSPAGNLRATGPIPGHLLPGGQLDSGGSNYRSDAPESAPAGQLGSCSPQGHLPLSFSERCAPRTLSLRAGRSSGIGAKPTWTNWWTTPWSYSRRLVVCATPPLRTAATVRARLPRTGQKRPSPRVCAASPDAPPAVNLATPVAPFNPALTPSTSRFIPCASANAAKTFPRNRRWILSVAKSSTYPLSAWNARSIGPKSKSAPTAGEPLGRPFRPTSTPLSNMGKTFAPCWLTSMTPKWAPAAASVKWAKRCLALLSVKAPCKRLAKSNTTPWRPLKIG